MPKRIQLLPVSDQLILISDDLKKQIVSAVPEEMRAKTDKLLEALQSYGIYVTKDDNKINYLGKSATGSSLLDLIKWALSEEKVPLPPDYRLFKKILTEAKLPDNFLPVKQKKEKSNKSDTNINQWISLYE